MAENQFEEKSREKGIKYDKWSRYKSRFRDIRS